jgi:hypothetical protein
MRTRLTIRIISSVAALAIGLAAAFGSALAAQGGGGQGNGVSGGALPGGGAIGGQGGGQGPAHPSDPRHDGDHRDAFYRPDVSPRQGDDPLHLIDGYDGPRPHDAYFEDHRLSGLFPDWRDWSFGPLFAFHSYGAADSQCIRRDVYGDVYRAC